MVARPQIYISLQVSLRYSQIRSGNHYLRSQTVGWRISGPHDIVLDVVADVTGRVAALAGGRSIPPRLGPLLHLALNVRIHGPINDFLKNLNLISILLLPFKYRLFLVLSAAAYFALVSTLLIDPVLVVEVAGRGIKWKIHAYRRLLAAAIVIRTEIGGELLRKNCAVVGLTVFFQISSDLDFLLYLLNKR